MKPVLRFWPLLVLITVAVSCTRKDEELKPESTEEEIIRKYLNLPASPFNYAHPDLPAFFNGQFVTIQNNTPIDNPVTDWGATLGRVLFYDTRLSRNYTISCSSCHIQKFGFTDTAQFSKGFTGGLTKRHSMALVNATYYLNGRFFWDERAATLEEQVLEPIQDAVEMGLELDTLVARLNATQFYPILFKYAFGSSNITSDRISKALAQFVRSLVSYQSKYDIGLSLALDRDKPFPNYTNEENQGKDLFINNIEINCFGCHNTDVFVTDNPRNNGISLTNPDIGVFIHTNNPLDIGKFKAPSLKNVALRGRYMNNGKFVGLMEVLNHYNTNIQPNPNLDPHLIGIDGKPSKKNMSPAEINALKAFLETLTDHQIIQDVKFSSPF